MGDDDIRLHAGLVEERTRHDRSHAVAGAILFGDPVRLLRSRIDRHAVGEGHEHRVPRLRLPGCAVDEQHSELDQIRLTRILGLLPELDHPGRFGVEDECLQGPPWPARCVVVSSGVAQPLRVDSGRGGSPRGDPPRACALHYGEQRGGDQDVGEERDAGREGREQAEDPHVGHLGEAEDPETRDQHEGRKEQRRSGRPKRLGHGKLEVPVLLEIALELVHEMNGVVDGDADHHGADHHRRRIDRDPSPARHREHRDDRQQVRHHADESAPQTSEQEHHERRDHAEREDVGPAHADDHRVEDVREQRHQARDLKCRATVEAFGDHDLRIVQELRKEQRIDEGNPHVQARHPIFGVDEFLGIVAAALLEEQQLLRDRVRRVRHAPHLGPVLVQRLMGLLHDLANRDRIRDDDGRLRHVGHFELDPLELAQNFGIIEPPGLPRIHQHVERDRTAQEPIDRLEVDPGPVVLGEPVQAVVAERDLHGPQ